MNHNSMIKAKVEHTDKKKNETSMSPRRRPMISSVSVDNACVKHVNHTSSDIFTPVRDIFCFSSLSIYRGFLFFFFSKNCFRGFSLFVVSVEEPKKKKKEQLWFWWQKCGSWEGNRTSHAGDIVRSVSGY